jgi:hypothetical protein
MNTIVDKQICGYCSTAWDLVYKRQRSVTSAEQWVGYCKEGGCDPDIWDYVDLPDDEVPQYMPHLFHRRDHSRPHGWQFSRKAKVQYSQEEFQEKELQERIEQKAVADEIEWDTDDEEEIEWE